MDIAVEQPFADVAGSRDRARRPARTAVLAAVLGALVLWGAAGALASGRSGGFVHDPISVSTSTGTMFSLPALAPGRTVTRYATVRSAGGPAAVRLFASVSGTGLARFLTITVTRGAHGASGFVPAGTGRGAGAGIVYSGPLSGFPTSWAGGIVLGTRWAPGAVETFRFRITMSDRAAAQGLTAGATFLWEARQA